MGSIRVGTTIDAPPRVVWDHVRDIASHTRWQADAHAIRLVRGRPNRVGARYEVDTRVGPLRLVDLIEVVEWDEGRAIGVRHVGLVTGTGRLRLRRRGRSRTRVTWEEDLAFPRRLGGGAAALAARPVLRRVWRGNLARLRQACERSAR